ncbi:MAG: hypothetical protein KGL39_45960 [Patescibacteria group bacterium]|nr:hypothetical protein [Patescibacteria group bacterium]
MKKNKQIIFDKDVGDCFRACLTSILGIPNDKELPNIDKKTWFGEWNKLLLWTGISLEFEKDRIWRTGYWIASVPSKNFNDRGHCVVMKGDNIAHDPSTHKKYKTGQSLLGKGIVDGGWYLVVDDPSKLHRLGELIDIYKKLIP